MNIVQSLGEYVNKVLDTNKDGVITFKDFIDLFPNSAIAIAVIFVDLVVGVAEYRVWDVGYQITDDPFKAFGFVLISAIPFYLGQIFWLYPVANFLQKSIAIGMIASSLYTSWIFGTADLTQNWDIPALVSTVTDMTAVYIVSALLVSSSCSVISIRFSIFSYSSSRLLNDCLSDLDNTVSNTPTAVSVLTKNPTNISVRCTMSICTISS